MKMKNAFGILLTLTVATLMIVSVPSSMLADKSEASSAITVTDGLGNVITLNAVPEHIAAIGFGAAETLMQIGAGDKIVVTDSYTGTDPSYNFEITSELRQRVANGEVKAGGNLYKSGINQLLIDINAASEKGAFDKEKDLVIVTNVTSNIYEQRVDMIKDPETCGCKNIIQWGYVPTYDDIIRFVETVSKATTGSVSEKVDQMRHVSKTISDTLVMHNITSTDMKKKAMFVTGGSPFKVGNTNSIANAMIAAAGGNSYTVDDSKNKPTYTPDNLTQTYIDGSFVFVDNTIASNQTNLDNLITAIGTEKNIIPLKPLWNNYCVSCMEGVWMMACAMYPEYFEGDVPTVPEKSNDNLFIYAGAGIIAVVSIGLLGYFFIKKK